VAAPIRLFLADVDGTLVTQDKVLTERAIAAVGKLKEAGILFASSPRRSRASTAACTFIPTCR
jgi:hydroxymethylpyrimidine pyrophosphatase-like HAD family hydrolase